MTDTTEFFELSHENGIAHLQLNRPERMNTMTPAFFPALRDAVRRLDGEGATRAMVISSTGKHFSAGMSLDVFAGSELALAATTARERLAFQESLRKLMDCFSALDEARFPIVCAIQGGCIGGALDLGGVAHAVHPYVDHYGAGLLARQHNQLAESLQQFTAATTASPGYGVAWLAQAETALMIGEQDVAGAAVEQGQRAAVSPSPALRRRLAAQRALIEGDPPAAVQQWRAVAVATPDDTDVELNLARARGAGGDFSGAVGALQTLSQRDGNDPRVWFELGKFSILRGDAQPAVDDYLVRALVQFKRSRDLYGHAETVNALGV